METIIIIDLGHIRTWVKYKKFIPQSSWSSEINILRSDTVSVILINQKTSLHSARRFLIKKNQRFIFSVLYTRYDNALSGISHLIFRW